MSCVVRVSGILVYYAIAKGSLEANGVLLVAKLERYDRAEQKLIKRG